MNHQVQKDLAIPVCVNFCQLTAQFIEICSCNDFHFEFLLKSTEHKALLPILCCGSLLNCSLYFVVKDIDKGLFAGT